MSSKKGKGSRGNTPLTLQPALQPCIVVVEDIWAQCDTCQKWRRLPAGAAAPPDDAPWYCKMNPDRSKNNCKAPEENYADNEHQWLLQDQGAAKGGKGGKSKGNSGAGAVSGNVRVIGAADLTPNGLLPGTIVASGHTKKEKKKKKSSLHATPEPGGQLSKKPRTGDGLRKEFTSVIEELRELVKACQQILANEGSWTAPRGADAALGLPAPPSMGPSHELPPPAWVWAGLQRLAPEAASIARLAVEELSAAEYASDAAQAAGMGAGGMGGGGLAGPARQQQLEAERIARLALAAAAAGALPKAEAAAANPALLASMPQAQAAAPAGLASASAAATPAGLPGVAPSQPGFRSATMTPVSASLIPSSSPSTDQQQQHQRQPQMLPAGAPLPQQAGLGPSSMHQAALQRHAAGTAPMQPSPAPFAGLGPGSSSSTPMTPMLGGVAAGIGGGSRTGGGRMGQEAVASTSGLQPWQQQQPQQQQYQQQQQPQQQYQQQLATAGAMRAPGMGAMPGAGSVAAAPSAAGTPTGIPGMTGVQPMMGMPGGGFGGFGSPQFMLHPNGGRQ